MKYAEIPHSTHLPYPPEEHVGRMAIGDDQAMAWAWIYSYARSLNRESYDDEEDDYYDYSPVSADELIDYGLSWINSTSEWGGNYLSKGGLLEGVGTDPTFWDKLAILKNLDIPQDKRENFFSCSC